MRLFNILQMISKNDRYGAQRVFLDQVAVLQRMGNAVIVVVRGKEGYVTDAVNALGIPCHGIPMRGLRDLLYLRRLVKDQRIDIIHTSLDRADYFGLLLSMITGRPVVSTMHVRRFHHGLRFADSVIVSSRQQAQTLRSRGVKPHNIHLIRPGIAVDRFAHPDGGKKDAWRKRLHIEDYSIIFNHISSLHTAKAHNVSIDLVASCKRRGLRPLLIIVGGELRGDYYHFLRTSIEQRDLTDNIVFTGWTPDIPEIMSLCHFTLLPSENEALGMVLVEGMAAGTLIVAREGEGGAELVKDYDAGLLYIPEEGVEPLAEKILSLFKNRKEYDQRSSRCTVTARQALSSAQYGARLMEVFHGLVY